MTKITQLLCREDRVWRKATRLTLHRAYRFLDVDVGKARDRMLLKQNQGWSRDQGRGFY